MCRCWCLYGFFFAEIAHAVPLSDGITDLTADRWRRPPPPFDDDRRRCLEAGMDALFGEAPSTAKTSTGYSKAGGALARLAPCLLPPPTGAKGSRALGGERGHVV